MAREVFLPPFGGPAESPDSGWGCFPITFIKTSFQCILLVSKDPGLEKRCRGRGGERKDRPLQDGRAARSGVAPCLRAVVSSRAARQLWRAARAWQHLPPCQE